jgi:cation diffusion facilitator family transporter
MNDLAQISLEAHLMRMNFNRSTSLSQLFALLPELDLPSSARQHIANDYRVQANYFGQSGLHRSTYSVCRRRHMRRRLVRRRADSPMKRIHQLAIGSIVVGVGVLALKYLAYWLTGSIALYSDALESIVNVATALAALISVRIAARPADAHHPYGYHKAEYFSAMLEGAMIIVAAILIMREAFFGLMNPKTLDAPLEGLLVNGVATVINGLWCWTLIVQGKRHRSPALNADGWHLFSDVVSSAGVVVGVLLAIVSGWPILDPALAAMVGLNVLWSGWGVLKTSTGGLLDQAVSDKALASIRQTISTHADGALEAHDLLTRHAGRRTFIEFHLVVPAKMTVDAAHAICDRLEQAIREDDEHAIVTIHIEPADAAKHTGIVII